MSTIHEVAELLWESKNTVFLTGAGMSVASGVPTFRGAEGLWQQEGLKEWANRKSFDDNPTAWYKIFWEQYGKKRKLQPSAAHIALADMLKDESRSLITQNIDGFDLKAGAPADRVLEVHGHDRTLTCTECEYLTTTGERYARKKTEPVPYCPDNHVLKPDMLLFGDDEVPGLISVHDAAEDAISYADSLVIIGTSLEIPYVADWVLNFAASERDTIIVNPSRTIADAGALLIVRQNAEVALPALQQVFTDMGI